MERRGGRAGIQLPGWGGAGKPQPQPCGGPLRAYGPASLCHPLRLPARACARAGMGLDLPGALPRFGQPKAARRRRLTTMGFDVKPVHVSGQG